jgi:NTE family protein
MSASDKQQSGVTLVLGTGFIKCAAAIGLYTVLQREQIPIRRLIGSSIGAVIAAAIGLGYTPEKIQDFVTRLSAFHKISGMSRQRWLQATLPGVFGFNEGFGLLNDTAYTALFREEFGEKTFGDSRVSLYITATNFVNGERVVLNDGLLWSALRASCTLLGLIPPIRRDSQLLTDGAASDPLPLSVAMERNASIIVTLGFENPPVQHIQSLPAFTYQLAGIISNQLLNSQIAFSSFTHHGEVIPILPKFGVAIDLGDVDRIPLAVEKGAEAAEGVIPYIKTLLGTEK